jgi:hypothetical protein
MKTRFYLLLLFSFLFTTRSFAQSIELRGDVMYTFQETFPVYGGNMRISDGATYAGTLAAIFADKAELKFTYQNQPAVLDYKRFPSQVGDYDNEATIQYFMLGFNRLHHLGGNDKVIPYTGGGFGIANLSFKSGKYESLTRAAFSINLGAKFMINERIGINTFAQLQAPISGFGLYIGAGTGGASAGVSTTSYVFQFGLGGGLIFKLK